MITFFRVLRMVGLGETLWDKLVILCHVLHIRTRFSPTITTKYGRFVCRSQSYDWKVLHPNYEKEVKKRLLVAMDSGYFVDVGANIGLYSVMVGKKEGCEVIAIEPEKENFRALKENIKLNNLAKKVLRLNVACHSKNTDVSFYRVSSGYACSPRLGNILVIKAAARTLDSILKSLKINLQDVKAVKVDVEGAEKDVFLGAEKLLDHGNPKVFFEALDTERLYWVSKILKNHGYVSTKIDERNYLAERRGIR